MASIVRWWTSVDSRAEEMVKGWIAATQEGTRNTEALNSLGELAEDPNFTEDEKKALFQVAYETQLAKTTRVYEQFKAVFGALQEAIRIYHEEWTRICSVARLTQLSEVQNLFKRCPIPRTISEHEGYERFMDQRRFMHEQHKVTTELHNLRMLITRDWRFELTMPAPAILPPDGGLPICKDSQNYRNMIQTRVQLEKNLESLEQTANEIRRLWQALQPDALICNLPNEETPDPQALLPRYEELLKLLDTCKDYQVELQPLVPLGTLDWEKELDLPTIQQVEAHKKASGLLPEAVPTPVTCCIIQ